LEPTSKNTPKSPRRLHPFSFPKVKEDIGDLDIDHVPALHRNPRDSCTFMA